MLCPAARRAGLLSAGAAGVLVGALAARFGWQFFFWTDAHGFWRIARQLSGAGLGPGEDAYRYGRMFYPLTGLLLAGGNRAWLQWSLPAVNCLAFGASAACGVELAVRHGRPVRHGLLVLVVPGLWLCLLVAWSEALLIALLLGFVVFHDARRNALAAVCLALAILTKESAALILVPFGVAALLGRDRKAFLVRAAAGVPALLWWSWTRVRLGEWPFLATTLSRSRAVGPPFDGFADLLRGDVTAIHVIEIGLVLAVAIGGIGFWLRHPSSVVAGAAAISCAFALCLGHNVLMYPGDTLRVLSPTLALLFAAVMVNGRARVPGADEPPAIAPTTDLPAGAAGAVHHG
jgi:hypothetical protein